MHAAPIMIVVLCALALGYRYYSAFLAAKVGYSYIDQPAAKKTFAMAAGLQS